jgi:hypothetical protein
VRSEGCPRSLAWPQACLRYSPTHRPHTPRHTFLYPWGGPTRRALTLVIHRVHKTPQPSRDVHFCGLAPFVCPLIVNTGRLFGLLPGREVRPLLAPTAPHAPIAPAGYLVSQVLDVSDDLRPEASHSVEFYASNGCLETRGAGVSSTLSRRRSWPVWGLAVAGEEEAERDGGVGADQGDPSPAARPPAPEQERREGD